MSGSAAVTPPASWTLPASVRRRLFVYLAGLLALVSAGDPNGGLIDVPISFILKNKMGLDAYDVAIFRFFASAPLFLAFLFGIFRDALVSGYDRDRSLMRWFSLANGLIYLVLLAVPVTYTSMLIASIITTSFFLVVLSAQSGLFVSVGQRHGVTGPISALWNAVSYMTAAAAFLIGGQVSQKLDTSDAFGAVHAVYGIAAAGSFAIFLLTVVRSTAILGSSDYDAPLVSRGFGLKDYVPLLPAFAIWSLWNFAPGAGTPLQYFLQNSLGASDAQWGLWNAIFTASFLPAFGLYGFLSYRVRFNRLLFWSTVLAIPQFIPILFIQSLDQAMIFAVASGLLGGMATSAYFDMIMRACPPKRGGVTIMMSATIYIASTRSGDVLGTFLYNGRGGFGACVATMTATYASILLILIWHRRIIARETTTR